MAGWKLPSKPPDRSRKQLVSRSQAQVRTRAMQVTETVEETLRRRQNKDQNQPRLHSLLKYVGTMCDDGVPVEIMGNPAHESPWSKNWFAVSPFWLNTAEIISDTQVNNFISRSGPASRVVYGKVPANMTLEVPTWCKDQYVEIWVSRQATCAWGSYPCERGQLHAGPAGEVYDPTRCAVICEWFSFTQPETFDSDSKPCEKSHHLHGGLGKLDGGLHSGLDGGLDAGLDAGLNAGLDGRLEGGLDAGLDCGLDAGLP